MNDQKKQLAKTLDSHTEEFEEIASRAIEGQSDKERILEKGAQKLNQLRKATFGEEFGAKCELGDAIQEYCELKSLETGVHMFRGIDPSLRSLAGQMVRDLTQEYKVKTSQEKAYLQMAVTAFCRYQNNMKLLEDWTRVAYKSQIWLGFINMLSKDAERAFRQYHTVIQYFESKRKPRLEVRVNAQTAFIAQNQQNIANNPLSDAINDPQ